MRKPMRIRAKPLAVGALFTLALAALVGAFSVVWLIWFIATLVSVAIYRWKRLPESGRRLTGILLALSLVAIMAFTGAAPKHFDPGSAAVSRLPIVSTLLSSPPAAYANASDSPQLDELQQAKDTFNLVDFRLRSQSNAVERALSLGDAVNRAVDFGQHAQLQITDLLDAKQSLDRTLDEKKLRTIDRLDDAKATLNAFLTQYEQQMSKVSTGDAARRVLTDFQLQSHEKSMDAVNDSVLRLEGALNHIAKDVIGNQLKAEAYNQVRLLEAENAIERDELISFATRNIAIKTIDATELMIGHGDDVIRQDLLVFFGDSEAAAQTPGNISAIPVRPGIQKITLIKRTVVSAGLSDLPTKLRLFPFRYFLLKWPTVFPAKVRLSLDLSSANLSREYPYSVEVAVDAAIKNMRLPADSLFNAGILYKAPRREGGEDIYETEAPLAPSYFQTHNYIWIELMPDSIYFRNKPVQDLKQYLFPENLIAALAVMALAGFGALIIGLGLKP